ncbi:citryl-CoA lyase [Chloroflexota bacterium]|nr:citryl-CoA lyase [Chloroflexota bacterium]
MATIKHWDTEISYTTEDQIRVRGYDLVEMMGTVPFSHVVHLLFTGELPSPKVGRVVDALMVASIDHGPGSPSALATRTAASGGACMKNAAVAGFLTLDKSHGAAVEDCMKVLIKVLELTEETSGGEEEKAAIVVDFLQSEKEAGRKIPGFGHRQHHHDPRVDKLFALTMDAGVNGQYLAIAQAISKALSERAGKELPINVDGAVAAILCELGYPVGLGNAPFLIARLSSLLIHAYEEIESMPRMRRIDPVDFGYVGVADRELPKFYQPEDEE